VVFITARFFLTSSWSKEIESSRKVLAQNKVLVSQNNPAQEHVVPYPGAAFI